MFRELKRKNKQISDAECIEVLTRETRGVLSVIGDEGYPYGMPMNHFYDPTDGKIWFHCGKASSHRTDALRHDNRVSFCVTEQGERAEGDWAYTVRSVIVFGKIEIIDDAEKIADIAARLSRKFTQDESYIAEEIRKFAAGTLLLELSPEHICGKRVVES
ncbi:MAG: pyridoxamine 5'-phosphate oxidase family protein [Ruminococcaceae bacterium]|nr:pyridoxamine 5'-phosphate oxidase family protein [Oscillospiraceae bacterium]